MFRVGKPFDKGKEVTVNQNKNVPLLLESLEIIAVLFPPSLLLPLQRGLWKRALLLEVYLCFFFFNAVKDCEYKMCKNLSPITTVTCSVP